jgi:putative transposase
MQRKTNFAAGEFYHIYNRGVDKRTIFSSRRNYERFMLLLHLSNSEEIVRLDNLLKTYSYEELIARPRKAPLVAIGAFCLMPNHFHLLVTPLSDTGITKFMLKLQTGYSMYFNKLNERSGSLFQGPFKSEHADDDTYLKYLFSYIHLNPAKLHDPHWRENGCGQSKIIQEFVEGYPYSSIKEYLRSERLITDPSHFPDYFASSEDLSTHITDWLETPTG